MFTSARYASLFLRLGLALVFLWSGADQFIHPNYWLSFYWPHWTSLQPVYALAIFQSLTGLGLIFNIFTKVFSLLAIIFLVVILVASGLSQTTLANVGLIGAFLAVLLWPDNRSRY